MKEKLGNASPLEWLKKLKESLTALWSSVFSHEKGFPAGSSDSDESLQDEPSPLARKKKLILFGLGGAAILLFGLLIIIIIVNTKPKNTDTFNISTGLSIPVDEFFFPSEPDFLPGFIPEREPRRFWTLDDIRPYWKAPGNTDWWMEEIISTVDSLMEGVP